MLDLLFDLAGELLFGAAVGAAVGTAVYLTLEYIDRKSVQKAVNDFKLEKCPSAVKAKILSKDTKKVSVGLFSNNGNQLESFEIEADRGVSNDIYVGQVYTV